MQTAMKLFSREAKPVAITLGDPCAVLIENSEHHFGLLLAESCGLAACPPDFLLENVFYFRASRNAVQRRNCEQIQLTRSGEIFIAKDLESGDVLPNCSERAYVVSYLSNADREELLLQVSCGRESLLFRWAQQRFGNLPGFEARDNALTSPPDYANIPPTAATFDF